MKEKYEYECRLTITIEERDIRWENILHLTNSKVESEIIQEVKSQQGYRMNINPSCIEVSNIRRIKKLKPKPAFGIK